jgi:tRNA modification GTPase
VVFIDTAGLREARDEIEVEGIRRSRESLAKAELILHVLDASEPLTPADEMYLAEFAAKKRILVRNKTDLPVKLELRVAVGQTFLSAGSGDFPVASPDTGKESPVNPQAGKPAPQVVDVCCLTGQGMEALKDAIKNLVWAGKIEAGMLQVMINSRHQEALGRARTATLRTIDALRADVTLELVALDLRIAVNAVGEIVGQTATDDLLDAIFSQFCLGK